MSDKKLFCANWKMNKTAEESTRYIKDLISILSKDEFGKGMIIIFPNFCFLNNLQEVLKFYKVDIKLGAQNFYPVESGAYTGETSINMLQSLGVEYFLIGHSERRYILGETQDFINRKVFFGLEKKVKIIYCFGEKLEERNQNKTEEIIKNQLEVFNQVPITDNIYFAYEPVWAIGTGVRATKEDIVNMINYVRNISNNKINKLIYGGSIDENNVEELATIDSLCGYLVGSASLDVKRFAEIIRKG